MTLLSSLIFLCFASKQTGSAFRTAPLICLTPLFQQSILLLQDPAAKAVAAGNAAATAPQDPAATNATAPPANASGAATAPPETAPAPAKPAAEPPAEPIVVAPAPVVQAEPEPEPEEEPKERPEPTDPNITFTQFFNPDVLLGSIVANDLPLTGFLRELSRERKIQLVVDNAIDIRVSLSMPNPKVGLNELINMLIHLYPLSAERVGGFVYIRPIPKPDLRNDVIYDRKADELGFYLDGMSLQDFSDTLIEVSGKNVFLNKSLDPTTLLKGHLARLPFKEALTTIALSNGLGVKEDKDVFTIGRVPGVQVKDDLIDIWFESAPLKQVLEKIAETGRHSIMFTDKIEGEVSVDLRAVTVDRLLRLLLANTNYSYNLIDGVHMIGLNTSAYLNKTEIVHFQNVHAGIVLKMIPPPLLEGISALEIKEQNSLVFMGEPTRVRTLTELAAQLDKTVPQVLLEVVMVEFTTDDLYDVGLNFTTGNNQTLFPELNLTVDGFRRSGNHYTITRLPANFSIKLRALQQDGKARILTKPHIAALSGNEASLVIGQTLYYRLNSEEVVGDQIPRVRTTEKIESVQANTMLKITPWVMGQDKMAIDIATEFNTFGGAVIDNVPPAMNVSSVKSTVRLRDGETIILAGLILNSQNINHAGLPLLSKVPILGALFRNLKKTTKLDETVIYITPHIYDDSLVSKEYVDPKVLDYKIEGPIEELKTKRALKKREEAEKQAARAEEAERKRAARAAEAAERKRLSEQVEPRPQYKADEPEEDLPSDPPGEEIEP